MIYLLYGEDGDKGREKLHSLVDSLRKKKPDASFTQFDEDTLDKVKIEELIGGQGLFERKLIVALDHVVKAKDVGEDVVRALKEFGESDNIFIFLEGALDKKTINKFEKHSEKTQEFNLKENKKKDEFSVFSIADALGRRDREKLWSKYREALYKGFSVEEIHGILFWQVKSLIVAAGSTSAAKSGLNPFVFRKAQDFLKNYSKEELRNLSDALVAVSHNSRRGKYNFEAALESLILSQNLRPNRLS
ncbi:MAG: hypothetical protein QF858_03860 [Candidatus Pacebacteria bacterium]|jgi:DNA polymerase III delta subunit|nr:hypothetical protein [Candidatus Paceibacterota bacterium]MDP6659763.1 hypothetical protein [Candidatus Paceibacterota bacterium]|tara:strand:+ start:8271 stop:9011 length:741 start_codon:yes stop_codon:yes gene_type:complete